MTKGNRTPSETLREMRHPIACFIGALMFALSTSTPAAPVEQAETSVVVNGRTYTMTEFEAAYTDIMRKYGLSSTHRKLDTLKNLKGTLIEGIPTQITGKRMILSTGSGPVAVMCKGSYSPGEASITLAVVELGKYSHRFPDGTRSSIQQYRDITLTRTEFLTHLRRGYAFAGLKGIDNQKAKKQLGSARPRQLGKAGAGKMLEKESGFSRKRTDLPEIKVPKSGKR